MSAKTYTQKSNAVRAQKTVTAKLGDHIVNSVVIGNKEIGFSLHFEVKHNTPTELSDYLTAQGHAYITQEAPKAKAPKAKAPKKDAKPKVVRERYNNVVWPVAGGKCDQIWQIAQRYYETTGKYPTRGAILEDCVAVGIDPNKATISCQLYSWRKFTNGKLAAQRA